MARSRSISLHQLAVLLHHLVALEAGQALQAHVEDRHRLRLGEREVRHQPLARLGRGLAGADRGDHLVELVEGLEDALQDVRPLLGLAQVVAGAPDDDGLAVVEEVLQQLLERHHPRLVVDDRQQDDAEGGLHLGQLVERVEDDLRDLAALDVEDDADALAVGLVAQVGDPFDLLLAHQLGDVLEQALLVDLVGDLGDDDGLAVAAQLGLDVGARPHLDDAAAGGVGGADALEAVDEAGGREVGAGDRPHQLLERDVGVVDQQVEGVHHLAQVVRRDVGRHADGDAGGAVDQQVGDARRQHQRLLLRAVVVGPPVHRLLVDVLADHLLGELGQAHLGVTHRRRVVAVERAEVALAVDQRVAHGEVLRHAHDGVVDGGVAVRVVLAHHVADDARRLLVRPVGAVAPLPHAVEDPPVHRLQAVPHVGQGAPDDHAHRVIEIAALHLLFDVDRDRRLEGEDAVVFAHASRGSLAG